DSIMFCLSKGLGAPVGSLLASSQKFIEQARVYRKALGGGMRQAGILAAAGLVALEKGSARLDVDHANAIFLAEGLSQLNGIKIDRASVQTNILVFDISGTGMNSSDFTRHLAGKNVLCSGISAEAVRIVTHLDIARADCEQALAAIRTV